MDKRRSPEFAAKQRARQQAMLREQRCPRCCKTMLASNSSFKSHQKWCDPVRKAALFWSKVERNGDDQCWGWKGHKRWDGYGRFRSLRKAVFAHRYSYEMHHGAIAAGLCVMHTCDRPECTNPKHLKLGTHTENMVDMRAKGRAADQRRAA